MWLRCRKRKLPWLKPVPSMRPRWPSRRAGSRRSLTPMLMRMRSLLVRACVGWGIRWKWALMSAAASFVTGRAFAAWDSGRPGDAPPYCRPSWLRFAPSCSSTWTTSRSIWAVPRRFRSTASPQDRWNLTLSAAIVALLDYWWAKYWMLFLLRRHRLSPRMRTWASPSASALYNGFLLWGATQTTEAWSIIAEEFVLAWSASFRELQRCSRANAAGASKARAILVSMLSPKGWLLAALGGRTTRRPSSTSTPSSSSFRTLLNVDWPCALVWRRRPDAFRSSRSIHSMPWQNLMTLERYLACGSC